MSARVRKGLRLVASVALAASALAAAPSVRAGAATPSPAQDVFAFGDAPFRGSTAYLRLEQPIVGMARSVSGNGYWEVASDGGVFTFGDAVYFGSTGNIRLQRPIVGIEGTPTGKGYWLVASDGGVFAFGDARFFGSMAKVRLNQPVIGITATPSGKGYWLLASDGGVFSFGDAAFHGSTGAMRIASHVVGLAAVATGGGYWLAAADGSIYSFGSARYEGSANHTRLNHPIVGIAPAHAGDGYWLVASDGGVFSFGGAPYFGSMAGVALGAKTVIAMEPSETGHGYWLLARRAAGSAPTAPPPPPSGPRETFGAGTFRVDKDIAAGTYRNSDSSGNCYWARLRAFTGSVDDIIADRFSTARQIVAIASGDAGFENELCGTWTIDNSPLTKSPTAPFTDGTFRVGRDVAAGVWRNSTSSAGCEWVRLSGFGGQTTDVIQHTFSTHGQTVRLLATDVGFEAEHCGTWTKVG